MLAPSFNSDSFLCDRTLMKIVGDGDDVITTGKKLSGFSGYEIDIRSYAGHVVETWRALFEASLNAPVTSSKNGVRLATYAPPFSTAPYPIPVLRMAHCCRQRRHALSLRARRCAGHVRPDGRGVRVVEVARSAVCCRRGGSWTSYLSPSRTRRLLRLH
jgi:hypothetical protein